MRKKGASLKKETLPFHKRPAAARLAARSQLYNDRRAAKPGQQNVLHVRCSEPKRGSAKARVAGEVFRIKGFLKDEDGKWMELNATHQELCIEPITEGQEVVIVIGEGLCEEKIRKYLKSAEKMVK